MWFNKTKERTVAVIGYPGHGKTVFLASLFWDCFRYLQEGFADGEHNFSLRAVTPTARKVFHQNAMLLRRRELPPANPRTTPEPATLEFVGVPHVTSRGRIDKWGRIRLTFFDIAGEIVDTVELLRAHAPFLPKADDVIFLFDPTEDDFDETLLKASLLLNTIYMAAPSSRQKHFVVAFSKSDELHSQSDDSYPFNAPTPDAKLLLEDLPAYLKEMARFSRQDYLLNLLPHAAEGVRLFLRGLPENTHYCAFSALGRKPVMGWSCANCGALNPEEPAECVQCHAAREGQGSKLCLAEKPVPSRVRDPLFWIFREAGVM